MKKIGLFLSILIVTMTMQAASYGGLTVNSWSIGQVSPTSFTSIDGKVTLNITNTRAKMSFSDISGVIYSKTGEMFIIGSVDNFSIRKGTSDIVVTGHGSLASYQAVLSLLRNFSLNPADYTADIKAKVKVGLLRTRQVEQKNVPLSTFIK